MEDTTGHGVDENKIVTDHTTNPYTTIPGSPREFFPFMFRNRSGAPLPAYTPAEMMKFFNFKKFEKIPLSSGGHKIQITIEPDASLAAQG